jgi:hypothetical protein
MQSGKVDLFLTNSDLPLAAGVGTGGVFNGVGSHLGLWRLGRDGVSSEARTELAEAQWRAHPMPPDSGLALRSKSPANVSSDWDSTQKHTHRKTLSMERIGSVCTIQFPLAPDNLSRIAKDKGFL